MLVKLPAGERTYAKTIGRSEFVNPRRYGAMTWQDYARCRLSVFTREEARAIVAYLEYKRDAAHAPEQKDLRESLEAEKRYVQDIQTG